MESLPEAIFIDEDDAVKIDWSRAIRNPHAARLREHGYSTHVRQSDGTVTVTRFSPEEVRDSQDRLGGQRFFDRQLKDFGLMAATPERERAFDRIVYESPSQHQPFLACPVSLLVSRGERVSVPKVTAGCATLLLTFVWHAEWKGTGELYAVPVAGLKKALEVFGLFKSNSNIAWTVAAPDTQLREFMSDHRVSSREQMLAAMHAALQCQ